MTKQPAPKPRTVEEIAERVWLDGEDDMHYEVFLAALREAADSAADARDAEWRERLRKEREELRQCMVRPLTENEALRFRASVFDWLDSRKDQA